MSKTIKKGNPSVRNFHFEIVTSANKILDILDYFLLSSVMKKYCKLDWYSTITISDNFDSSIIDIYFDSLNDFCYIKLVCNQKYIFVRK